MTQAPPAAILGDPNGVEAIGRAWSAAGDAIGRLGGEIGQNTPGGWAGNGSNVFRDALGSHFSPHLQHAGQVLLEASSHAISFSGLLANYQATDNGLRQQISESQSALTQKQGQHSSTQTSISATQAKYNAATDPVSKKQHGSVLSTLGSALRSLEGDIERLVAEIAALIERAWTNHDNYIDDVVRHSGLIRDLMEAMAPIALGLGAVATSVGGRGITALEGFDGLLGAGARSADGLMADAFGLARDVDKSAWTKAYGGVMSIFGTADDLIGAVSDKTLLEAPDWLLRGMSDEGAIEDFTFLGKFNPFAMASGINSGLSVLDGVMGAFDQYDSVAGGRLLKFGAAGMTGAADGLIQYFPVTRVPNALTLGSLQDDANIMIGIGAGLLHGGASGGMQAWNKEVDAVTNPTAPGHVLNAAYWLNKPVTWLANEAYDPTNAPMKFLDNGADWAVGAGSATVHAVGAVGGHVASAVSSAASTAGHVAGDVGHVASQGADDVASGFKHAVSWL